MEVIKQSNTIQTSGFVHLHVHSEYSLLDGACRIKELVARVKELGQTAVAVTDHGCMYGAIEFYNEALRQGIKPIIGCEVYVAPRTRHDKVHKLDNSPYHLVLLCENNEGYQNLIKLVSIGYIEGFYSKPRVDVEVLRQYSKGLIALSACLAGEIARDLTGNDYEAAKQAALLYRNIFGEDNYFIEVQNHGIEEQLRILPHQYRLARETGIPLVATNDAHYILKNDAKMQRVLLAIQTNTRIDDPSGIEFPTDEFYIKSEEEMSALFKAVPDAIRNTVRIAERCNVHFEFGVIKLPKFTLEGVTDNTQFFKAVCVRGMKKYYGEHPSSQVVERLQYEFDIIIKMGYVDYFLIVWDFIRYAKENGIPVGPGRGSGAGSLAAYCMGITGIDPLKYNLLFERFLNPERVTMPDFDIDFCYEGRSRVIDYVVHKYGSERVTQIITFGTMAARAAIRDVGRAMGVPYQTVDMVAKCIPFEANTAMTIDRALEISEEFRQLYYNDTTIKELIDMARRVEGMPRHASTHAAGVVIASAPVREFVPLQKNEDSIVTQYTMTILENLGLLKMDFLGLRNLTVIRDCVKEVRRYEPEFDIEKVPLDDKPVFDMLSQGRSEGVFQFESAGMKQVLTRLMPETLEDLIAVISLYRPGPMESIPKYIANRHDPARVTYKTPLLKDILDVTYGCIVYQEQVMQIFRNLAGYSYGRADLVRRAMAKKKASIMEKERHSFIYGDTNEDGSVNCVGAVANGVPEAVANDIFDEMSSFASYAFNKSHAAAYAYLAYQTAYLKCHYYKEYMAALMTSVLDHTSKLIEYISECKDNSIAILNPDINESYEGFTAVKGGIRFGLLAIRNLGRGVLAAIIRERELHGAFASLRDFCARMHDNDLNKRALESLVKCGTFDGFELNRCQQLENYERILSDYTNRSRSNVEGQLDLFGQAQQITPGLTEEIPYVPELPLEVRLAMEKEAIGMYISGHPLEAYKRLIRIRQLPTLSQAVENARAGEKNFKDGDSITVLAMLHSRKMHTTRSNTQMCFLDLEDMTGSMEAVVFPKIYDEYANKLKNGIILLFSGRLSLKDEENASLIIEKISAAADFMSASERMKLCIKLKSTEQTLVQKIVRLASEHPGATRLCFYFTDIGKLTAHKDISGIQLSEEFLQRVFGAVGEENAALIP